MSVVTEADRERWHRYKTSERGRALAEKRRKERMTTDQAFAEKRREDGRRYYARHPQKMAAKNAKNNAAYARAIRSSNLRGLYGITVEQYEQMLEWQNGLCAICGGSDPGGKKRYLSVDHDHTTGAVRQLLCDPCNNGLGRFKDDPELLLKALAYLKKHGAG